MSASAIRDWWLFDQVEPLGPRELRMQLATLCAVFVNANRDPKKTKPVGAEEFLLREESEEDRRQRQTRQMLDILRAVAVPGKPKRRKRAKGRK